MGTWVHLSRYSADDEARRLAALNPGRRFFVLAALRYWEKNDVKVVDLEEEEEPPF